MRTICFFASHYPGASIPEYIRVYLVELKKHFSQVVLLSTQKKAGTGDLDFLNKEQIQLSPESNEGFDFGLWYKAFHKFDVSAFDKVALVNDSCILFAPLDDFMKWSAGNTADLQGMTASDAVEPHIQSYFMILNRKAVAIAEEYFDRHKVLGSLHEVIHTYEIGLSSYLLAKGCTMAAYLDNAGYSGEFSPYYHRVEHHISKGSPLIKRKILFSSFRRDELFTLARMNFRIDPGHYIRLIKGRNKKLLLDIEKLVQENGKGMTGGEKFRYGFQRMAIQLLRPVYRLFRRA